MDLLFSAPMSRTEFCADLFETFITFSYFGAPFDMHVLIILLEHGAAEPGSEKRRKKGQQRDPRGPVNHPVVPLMKSKKLKNA